jgi:NAD+ kinase
VSATSAKKIERIGIVAAPHRPGAAELARELAGELTARGLQCIVDETVREACPGDVQSGTVAECAESDLVIVLGGDGTLLGAAREAAPHGTPLLGVDLGSFGFLAAERAELLMGHLDELLAGQFEVERRIMLQVEAAGAAPTLALNDVIVARTVHGRMIRVFTSLDGDHIATFPADGLIVATPTGSTGYTLSAGGPIVDARMAAMVLTPVCPHTLYSRPLVVPAEAVVTLRLEGDGKAEPSAVFHVDGLEVGTLQQGAEVTIRRASQDALLVRLGGSPFYERLRQKLRWGAER